MVVEVVVPLWCGDSNKVVITRWLWYAYLVWQNNQISFGNVDASLSDPLFLPHTRSSSTTLLSSGYIGVGVGAGTIPTFEHGKKNTHTLILPLKQLWYMQDIKVLKCPPQTLSLEQPHLLSSGKPCRHPLRCRQGIVAHGIGVVGNEGGGRERFLTWMKMLIKLAPKKYIWLPFFNIVHSLFLLLYQRSIISVFPSSNTGSEYWRQQRQPT